MRRTLILLVALSITGVGCGDDDNGQTNNNNYVPATDLTAVTYNTGLARGFVGLADERAPEVTAAIADLDANVVCVQEVWQPAHVTMLSDAAAATLPNQVFLEDMPDLNPGDPACDETSPQVQALQTCAVDNCGTVPPDDLADCALAACGLQFAALTQECTVCIYSNVGLPIDEVFNICTSASQAYAYNGAFGIGLLTDQPIATSDSSVFTSTLNRRAVIHAELDTEAFGPVHVFCTHLTANLSLDYPKPTGSWQAEQRMQIDEMRRYINDTAGTEMVVLMGDFNCGPEDPGGAWAADLPLNYDVLSGGYEAPFIDSANAACTFCRDNPLVGTVDHDEDVLIDHILVKNFQGLTDAQRVLDEPLTVTVGATPIETAYSDHYGVSVTFSQVLPD